jgi:hypothetical protein
VTSLRKRGLAVFFIPLAPCYNARKVAIKWQAWESQRFVPLMKKVAVGKRVLENYLSRLFKVDNSKSANINERPSFSGRRYLLVLLSAFVIGLTMIATMADEVWAAIELAYYRAAATNNAVFLEWATVREVNINGFEILCKRVNDPETAFHPIGSRIALGNATTGATYNFDVTSGLVPGERYCFRLREITNDLTPGEAFDLCGYGLGLTPPPTPVSVVVSIPVTLTPTIVAVTAVPGLPTPPPVLPTQPPPVIPTQPESFLPTPTLDPAIQQQMNPVQPTSPLTSTLAVQEPLIDSAAAGAQFTATETPTATFMPVEEPTATATMTPAATLTNTTPVTVSQSAGAMAGGDSNALPVIPDNAAALAMTEATPTPLYVVVTATPTPLPALVVAPTFTPWPTAIPTETFNLANLLVPNTQNLMVGLLCLIFLSASGLGALGIVTSVLYMRSQSRRDRLPGPTTYERRRY